MELLKYFVKEYEISSHKLIEFNKIKIELESLKTQLKECKKQSEIEHENIIRENNEKINILQNIKYNEIQNIEEISRVKQEKLKSALEEKEEIIEKINNEYNLLKSQLNFVENNLEGYKISKKDME